jgi:hypothetical protein
LTSLFESPWPGLVIWSILYVSDYAFTIVCARMYRSGGNQKLAIEGSFELTPYFQHDINALKIFSPRFLVMLVVTGFLLAGVWLLTAQSTPELYEFLLGAMIVLELTVHVRHIHNFFNFRLFDKPGFVHGRIEYVRVFVLRLSSTDLFAFSILYLALFAFTLNWFVLGGAASCASTAFKHFRLARRESAKSSASAQPERHP